MSRCSGADRQCRRQADAVTTRGRLGRLSAHGSRIMACAAGTEPILPEEPDEPNDQPDFEYTTEDERDRGGYAAAAKYRAAGGDRNGWIIIFDGGLSADRWRRRETGEAWYGPMAFDSCRDQGPRGRRRRVEPLARGHTRHSLSGDERAGRVADSSNQEETREHVTASFAIRVHGRTPAVFLLYSRARRALLERQFP
jgi:hypothetical protein